MTPAQMGLSPRVRGNHPDIDGAALVQGSIPTCAGEPQQAGNRRGGVKVYPRVCGGTGNGLRKTAAAQGLSPRVRGNRTAIMYRL